jgi:hypothetical protein
MNMTGSKTSGSFSGVAVPAAAREPEPPPLARSLLSSRKLLRKAERSGGWGRDGEVAAEEDEEERDGEPPGAVVAEGKELDEKENGKGMMVGAGTVTSSRKSPRHSGQESSPAAAAEATRRTVRLHW